MGQGPERLLFGENSSSDQRGSNHDLDELYTPFENLMSNYKISQTMFLFLFDSVPESSSTLRLDVVLAAGGPAL